MALFFRAPSANLVGMIKSGHRVLVLAMTLLVAASSGAGERKHPDDLVSNKQLPDVFTSADGSKVAAQDDWARRRTEVLELVQAYEYGHLPPPAPVTASEQAWTPPESAKEREAKRAENAVPLPAGATETHLLLKTGPDGKISIPLVLTR